MYSSVRYSQLEQGARYLAALAKDETERQLHLGWANRYFRLASDGPSAFPAPSAAMQPAHGG